MATSIFRNGFGGKAGGSIEKLLKELGRRPLDGVGAPFVRQDERGGRTHFIGAFVHRAYTFDILTTDPSVVTALTDAIRASQQRSDYVPMLPLPWLALDAAEGRALLAEVIATLELARERVETADRTGKGRGAMARIDATLGSLRALGPAP